MSKRFVAIEGIDGSGKSTQMGLLATRLTEGGRAVESLHFPRYDSPYYGELIARFLRGEFGSVESVDPYLVSLLYAGDRADVAPTISRWLESGRFVVVDRYVYSNIAFQAAKISDPAKKQALADWLLDFEFSYNGIPRPDLSLLLNVPFSFVLATLRESRDGPGREYLRGSPDIHESSQSLQERVLHEYLRLTDTRPDFRRVDCFDPSGHILGPEEIHSRIWSALGGGEAP